MQFRRKSFLYRFNHWWNFLDSDFPLLPDLSEHTNTCCLFWNTVFSLFIGWPVVFLVEFGMTLIALVLLGVILLVAFLAGKKPNLSGLDVLDFADIESLPAIRGHKLCPVYFVALGYLVFLAIKYVVVAKWTAMVLLGVVLLTAVVFAISLIFKSSSYKALRAWVVAKKQKYCLEVDFVD